MEDIIAENTEKNQENLSKKPYLRQQIAPTSSKQLYFRFSHEQWGTSYKTIKHMLNMIANSLVKTEFQVTKNLNLIVKIGKLRGRNANTKNFNKMLDGMSDEEKGYFIDKTFPLMAELALKAEKIFPSNSLEILLSQQ